MNYVDDIRQSSPSSSSYDRHPIMQSITATVVHSLISVEHSQLVKHVAAHVVPRLCFMFDNSGDNLRRTVDQKTKCSIELQ